MRKALERRGVGDHGVHRRVEVGKEALEIGNRRAAIDPVGSTPDLDLARVTRSAGHPDSFATHRSGYGEPDRQDGSGVFVIQQIAVAGQVTVKEPHTVRLFQRHHPPERYNLRALVLAVKTGARRQRPVRALVNRRHAEDRRRRWRQGATDAEKNYDHDKKEPTHFRLMPKGYATFVQFPSVRNLSLLGRRNVLPLNSVA